MNTRFSQAMNITGKRMGLEADAVCSKRLKSAPLDHATAVKKSTCIIHGRLADKTHITIRFRYKTITKQWAFWNYAFQHANSTNIAIVLILHRVQDDLQCALFLVDGESGSVSNVEILPRHVPLTSEAAPLQTEDSIKDSASRLLTRKDLMFYFTPNKSVMTINGQPLSTADTAYLNEHLIAGAVVPSCRLWRTVDNTLYLVHLHGRQPQAVMLGPRKSSPLRVPPRCNIILQQCVQVQLCRQLDTTQWSHFCEQVNFALHEYPLFFHRLQSLTLNPDTWGSLLKFSFPQSELSQLGDIRVRTIQTFSSLLRFSGHRLDLLRQDRAYGHAEIMFHGVRSDTDKNVANIVANISRSGFNPKCAINETFGGGGIYCSPSAKCALGYTSRDESGRFHILLCLVLVGCWRDGGRPHQKMEPGQHSWRALSGNDKIFSVESNGILPILDISFTKNCC